MYVRGGAMRGKVKLVDAEWTSLGRLFCRQLDRAVSGAPMSEAVVGPRRRVRRQGVRRPPTPAEQSGAR
jgi:hypothetical protein